MTHVFFSFDFWKIVKFFKLIYVITFAILNQKFKENCEKFQFSNTKLEWNSKLIVEIYKVLELALECYRELPEKIVFKWNYVAKKHILMKK